MAEPATLDPLTAALAAIRERGYRNGATGAQCARLSDAAAEDVPLLLGLVEAVLALHRPDGYSMEIKPCKHHSVTRTDLAAADLAAAQRACPDCRVTEYARCWQHGCPGPWPCPTYSAIAAELPSKDTAKGGSDAH